MKQLRAGKLYEVNPAIEEESRMCGRVCGSSYLLPESQIIIVSPPESMLIILIYPCDISTQKMRIRGEAILSNFCNSNLARPVC